MNKAVFPFLPLFPASLFFDLRRVKLRVMSALVDRVAIRKKWWVNHPQVTCTAPARPPSPNLKAGPCLANRHVHLGVY